MTPGDGVKPEEAGEKSLGEIVSEVSEKASLLIREEIELAKAEVQQKVSKLARGAGVAVAAGVFLGFLVGILLQALSWFWVDLFNFSQPWMGFAITTGIMFFLTVVAGILAARWLRGGTPPTPELAIEEARRTREQLEWQDVERDQVDRTLEKGEELRA
jgi:hypothetical protein